MTLDPIFPPLYSIIVASLLAVIFVWLEWRKNSRFSILRYIAQLLMIASILAVVLRPLIPREVNKGEIILLTENFSSEIVDSLVSLNPTARVMRVQQAESYPDAEVVQSVHELDDDSHNIRFVVGDGLPVSYLDDHKEVNFTFFPSPAPKGIAS